MNYFLRFDIPTERVNPMLSADTEQIADFSFNNCRDRFFEGQLCLQNTNTGRITFIFIYNGDKFNSFKELKDKISSDAELILDKAFTYVDNDYEKYLKGQYTNFFAHIKKFDDYTFIENDVDNYVGTAFIWKILQPSDKF